MSKPVDSEPIYGVCALAVPVNIYAHRLGPSNFRIRFARGIGWAPMRYRTEAEVLTALLGMKSYTVTEVQMVKAMCKQEP